MIMLIYTPVRLLRVGQLVTTDQGFLTGDHVGKILRIEQMGETYAIEIEWSGLDVSQIIRTKVGKVYPKSDLTLAGDVLVQTIAQ
jgi:hypothetical protein